MNNRTLLPLLWIICFWVITGCNSVTDGSKRGQPNIIFILADDMGYADLGVYGQLRIQTPNLDTLAAEGIRFTQHYAGSTVCAPSRGVLMTGNHTGKAYIKGNFAMQTEGNLPIPDTTVTVAELLQQAGYRTGMIGKWGLGGPGSVGGPNNQGFVYSYGYLDQRNAHEYYPPYVWENEQKVFLDNQNGQNEYTHDLFTQKALQFINEDSEQPFFLYLPYTIPHGKYQVPSDAPYGSRSWNQEEKNYAAMITRMDRDVGRILDLIKENDIDEETILFFASDNGPVDNAISRFFDSNGTLRGYKTDLLEGGIRVPLIVRWPGTIQEGLVSDHVSAFWDFLPTACDLAGIDIPTETDGISYLPELLGHEQPNHDYLYWEYFKYYFGWESGDAGPRNSFAQQAVRMGKWKGLRSNIQNNPAAPVQLYNLEKDLGENTDVAAQHPDIVEQIQKIFREAHHDTEFFQTERL
ncbi:MAG: arylsulfatase [Balneolaceae bacterium]|nr:arylsulfatase [Balneolaceae bacterium]